MLTCLRPIFKKYTQLVVGIFLAKKILAHMFMDLLSVDLPEAESFHIPRTHFVFLISIVYLLVLC